ncbi:asparagine synthase (glutamine-hydrolysing) [freshwater sediment metagenome]|uniref:Asparagine synthase (Glutamine-hydrolysing) n=1 Tax=freshwater sediment metagenome TaxID=556182 RepID=A0AA48M628_9ZZZZ
MSYSVVFSRAGSPVLSALPSLSPGNKVAFESEYAALVINRSNGFSPSVERASLKSGRLGIVGRIRLDGRDALLESIGDSATGDAELCLLSYLRWGEQCTEHLQGDFSFAIWDEDKQSLFCARDQLGVRPQFYAERDGVLYVSDSLEEIRAVINATTLDDLWVLDFLTTGYSQEFHRSVYKDISRVPPAHILTASRAGLTVRRYWRLELDSPIFLRDEDYFEQFHQLVAAAIKDRLPKEGRVGISMSGGLDSTTLAAHAVAISGSPERVIAETRYFAQLIHDDEAYFSSLVAQELGVKHILTPIDDTFFDPFWRTRGIRTPEPTYSILSMYPKFGIAAEMAREAPVWFCGEGPDNALTHEWQAYLRWLWAQEDWTRFAAALRTFVFGRSLRAWAITVKRKVSVYLASEKRHGADWLNEEFANMLGGRETIENRIAGGDHPEHPWRPSAMSSLADPIWQDFLENFDPAVTQTPLEWRHPFLDLRVLNFLLRTPPIPWASRKLLIRRAMEGMLPREILSRNKTPLSEDPMSKLTQKEEHQPLYLCEEARYYVNEAALPRRPRNATEQYELQMVHILDHWLRNRH